MAKATHFGTCQWCSARQKLPSGTMATHGYTVPNGWFHGVCPGSGTAPFEQSCALIAKSIEWANAQRSRMLKSIEDVLAIDPQGSEGWKHIYHPELWTRTYGSVYLWEFGRYEPKSGNDYIHEFVVGDKRHHTNPGRLSDKVQTGNQAYIAHLQRQIAEIENYVIRQQQRVDAWAPQPLTPISENESQAA